MRTWKSALFTSLLLVPFACGSDKSDDPIDDKPADGPDAGDVVETTVPRVEDDLCKFTVPPELGLTADEFRCGNLVVYEDRALGEGTTIKVHYIQIDGADTGDATIYLDGGPGGDGNSILYAIAAGDPTVREALLGHGDLLVISQRGTGLSEPALICGQGAQSAGACANQLGQVADLPAYNTAYNADDVDDLREVLGYDKLNLYGISYGSRLALEVLRRHGDNVRAAIAGGTVPAHRIWPAETPVNFHGALSALNASCQDDAGCAAAYGDLVEDVINGIDHLNETPAEATVFGQSFMIDGDLYVALIFQLLYARATYGILPLVISDLAEGEVERAQDLLLELFLGQGGGGGQMADGMYMSVVCGEIFNPPPADGVFEAANLEVPSNIVEAMSPNWYGVQQQCTQWQLGEPMPELGELVVSDVPTLLSNGRLDPITPPRFGEAAAEGLANGQIANFANSGHGSTLQTPCGAKVLSDFLANPDQALDLSCTDEISIEFQLPAAVAPLTEAQRKQIAIELARAPIPPFIRERMPKLDYPK